VEIAEVVFLLNFFGADFGGDINQSIFLKYMAKGFFFFYMILLMIGFGNSSIAAGVTEQIQIPSSPNPVGSGARALGMGGAFIAIADDATAASWNPGGLTQLERPEISFVGAYFNRSIDTSFSDFPEASGEHSVSETTLNYFSVSYPFQSFDRNMTISLNYQNLYDFNNRWNFPIHQSADGLTVTQNIDASQKGSLSALGFAYCIQIMQNLSLGATFNYWDDGHLNKNQWEQSTNRTISGSIGGIPITGKSYSKDTNDFSGINFNLGVLWNLSEKWTLGAVLKTPFTADIKHSRYFYTSTQYLDFDNEQEDFFIGNEKLEMPMSYGIGVAYRMSDALTVSADIYRTEWGAYIHEDANGNKSSPITGTPESQADIDATHQVRLGAEYLFIKPKYAIPLRGGLFYDPAPAKGNPDNYFGLSLGTGIVYKAFIFDIACQYRFGKDVGQSVSESINSTQDVGEITIYSSIIIHF
jgi:long-chain fatty acid transport protein